MTGKYHSDTQEKIERLGYSPKCEDSGDLETATKTITATSEPSGLGNADYSKSLTLPQPADARLLVRRIASRLAVTIDSFDTATHLYCRVYVDAQDAQHLLLDTDFTATGENLATVDTHSGNKATIFNLLKDGSAHTFYFFLWINQANNAVISAVQLWEGVGTCSTDRQEVLRLDFSGISSVYVRHVCKGTGSQNCGIAHFSGSPDMYLANSDSTGHLRIPVAVINSNRVILSGTVATDLIYIYQIMCNLRSEQ